MTIRLLRTAVPLVLLGTLLTLRQVSAAPPTPAAAGRNDALSRATPESKEESRALPAPDWNREEQWAYRKLSQPTTVDFLDLPLEDAMTFLQEYHNFPMQFDEAAVKESKTPIDTPVTLRIAGESLQRILNLMLPPHDLDWRIEGAAVVVSTPAATAAAIRGRLEKRLEPEVAIVDHVCELSDAQRQRLELAGRAAIQRLVEGIAERRTKFEQLKDEPEQTSRLHLEIEELQRSVETGPFGTDKIFRKSLETMLTKEQLVKYAPIRTVVQAGGLVGTLVRDDEVLLGARLIGNRFDDDALARLSDLAILKFLRLDGTKVTDAGLASLHKLTNLQELYLANTRITDAGLVRLERLERLQVLGLYGTPITDEGLKHLERLTDLRELDHRRRTCSLGGREEIAVAPPQSDEDYGRRG